MAICFGVPCFTLIVVLVLLLMFFMKRTQAKNEIIGKAIDANYQLPDSFFNSQTGSQTFVSYNIACRRLCLDSVLRGKRYVVSSLSCRRNPVLSRGG